MIGHPRAFDVASFVHAFVIALIVLVPVYFALGFVTGVFGICSSASPGFTTLYTDFVPWLGPPLAALIGWRIARSKALDRARDAARAAFMQGVDSKHAMPHESRPDSPDEAR